MNRITCRLAVVTSAFLVITSFGAVGQAFAADHNPGSETAATEGHGIQPLPAGYAASADTPEALAQKPLTDALSDLHVLYMEKLFLIDGSTVARSDSDDLDTRIKQAENKVATLAGKPLAEVDPPPVFGAARSQMAASTSAKSLPLTHSTQSTSYWCGPASTAMAIRASGGGEYSRYNSSHKMTQTRLASSTYLATTTSGTSMSRIPVAVDRWAGIKSTYFPRPTVTNLKAHVMYEIIAHDKAVVYGTRELKGANNPHYNFHYKTFQIDHIIAGYGFTASGNTLRYADPVAGRWTNTGQSEAPHKTRSMQAASMTKFIAPWGVVA